MNYALSNIRILTCTAYILVMVKFHLPTVSIQ